MGREYNSTSESAALKGGVAPTYLAQTGTKLAYVLGLSSGY